MYIWTVGSSGELSSNCTEISSFLSCLPLACHGIKDRGQSGGVCVKYVQLTPSTQQVTESWVSPKEKLAPRAYQLRSTLETAQGVHQQCGVGVFGPLT